MDTKNEETTTGERSVDPIAIINQRLDAQEQVNNQILEAVRVLAAGTPRPRDESAPAAGSFRAAAPTSAPVVVEVKEKSPEEQFIDKIVDRLQARLGLAAAPGVQPEPGGPCKHCQGEGKLYGADCGRCFATGIEPSRRLS